MKYEITLKDIVTKERFHVSANCETREFCLIRDILLGGEYVVVDVDLEDELSTWCVKQGILRE